LWALLRGGGVQGAAGCPLVVATLADGTCAIGTGSAEVKDEVKWGGGKGEKGGCADGSGPPAGKLITRGRVEEDEEEEESMLLLPVVKEGAGNCKLLGVRAEVGPG